MVDVVTAYERPDERPEEYRRVVREVEDGWTMRRERGHDERDRVESRFAVARYEMGRVELE